MTKDTKPAIRINHAVFWPPLLVLLVTIGISLVSLEKFGEILTTSYGFMADNTTWLFQLTCFSSIILLVFMLFSDAGNLRLGGKDAKPSYTTWQWFAMILCGGIGIGVIFWGLAEPMKIFSKPPPMAGVEPLTEKAAIWAMSQSFLHWGITPYALYTLFGILIGLAHFNYGFSMKASSAYGFIFGRKMSPVISNIIDILCVLVLAGGLTSGLGSGVLQIASGLEFMFGIPVSPMVWATLTVAVAFVFTLSSYVGLDKCLKFLADQNAKIFFAVMIFVLLAGPTRFILELGVQSFGDYLFTFIPRSLATSPVHHDDFIRWFDVYFWAIWLSYAPIMGLFLARISKGRTIKQFIMANLAGPALFGIIWFAVFGGAGIYSELFEGSGLAKALDEKGMEVSVFAFFQNFPLGSILNPLLLLLVLLSFITLADPMTSAISSSCCKLPDSYSGEPPQAMKLIWGISIGAIAFTAILFAGLDGLRMLLVLFGFPGMLLALVAMVSAIKVIWYPHEAWTDGKRGLFPSLEQQVDKDN